MAGREGRTCLPAIVSDGNRGKGKMETICAGVDIGGTTIKIGIFTVAGRLLEKWELPTRKGGNGTYIFEDTAASLKGFFQEIGYSHKEVAGIGLGFPGALSPDGYLEHCVNVGMENTYPAREFKRLFPDILVAAENDANVAALGEQWKGSGKGFSKLVMLTLGTGVGGGIIVNGRLVNGARGMAGELGHMRVNFSETDQCNCKNYGCLEQYASATGIVKEMEHSLKASGEASSLRGRKSFSCKDVLDEAKAGDCLSIQTVKRCMGYLALAMHYTAHVVDPELFIIGGGVSRAGQFLLNLIREQFEADMTYSKEKALVRLASLGNDAGMFGAARLVLRQG